jgi:hypothetical protein
VWWSGLSTADAKRGLELVRLEKMTMGEKVNWGPGSHETPSSITAHLLPVYDEYFVAYKDRESVFGSPDNQSTWDTLGPAIVINGVAAGTWKRTNDKKSVEVKFSRALKKTERAAMAQAMSRYVEFLAV